MAHFRLKEIAEPERWSIRELSRQTGLAFNTVQGIWSNRAKRIDLDTLQCLADKLGVSACDLIANGEPGEEEGNYQPVLMAA